jgi:hypothetical protein
MAMVMAGGQGSRLMPLTEKRSKPPVPTAPASECIGGSGTMHATRQAEGRCPRLPRNRLITNNEERVMSIAKVIEISAESVDSFEDAIRSGIEEANNRVRNVEGAWIKEHKVVVRDGKVSAFRVDMKVTFVLD